MRSYFAALLVLSITSAIEIALDTSEDVSTQIPARGFDVTLDLNKNDVADLREVLR